MEYERTRLVQAGKDHLARNIEQVSKTHGDQAGYDIRSYEVTGRDRFVEVKTTRYGKLTPFYISEGEVRFSGANLDAYHLYRLFNFRKGPVSSYCPETYGNTSGCAPSTTARISDGPPRPEAWKRGVPCNAELTAPMWTRLAARAEAS